MLVAATAAASLLTAAAAAQDWAKANLAKSSRHGEYVTITEPSGRQLNAWVVYPEVKDKAPVVVMIHEIFGLSDWAREMADEVAGAGYIVVEPDLLSGFGPPRLAVRMTPMNLPASPQESSASIQSEEAQLRALWVRVNAQCEPIDCGPDQRPAIAIVENDGKNGQPVKVRLAYQSSISPSAQMRPALFTTLPISQQGQPPQQYHMDHPGMMDAQDNGLPYIPAHPGGTAAFPDQSAVVRAVSSLPDAQVLADLDAAADYGKKLPAASGKLFVAGFCWGGGKSFLFATHRHDLSAAFVFYGPPPPAALMKDITAPVYGFYAGNDARITATIPKTQDEMKADGKTYEPVTYDGAGHGFMRAGESPDANAANTAARQEGFHRFISLLGGVH
jgi:dienelactone hydrolase